MFRSGSFTTPVRGKALMRHGRANRRVLRMNLATINDWIADEAREAFRRCCGSTRWCREMEMAAPV